MPIAHLHLESGQETLAAVTLGAVVAAASGFFANQLESRLRRHEEERSAALLFSEILSALELILEVAVAMHGRGDPFGPATLRTVRAAQHETRTYERNRESLFRIRDATLRARLHSLLLRLAISLDGVLEAGLPPGREAGDDTSLLGRLSDRDSAFAYAVQLARQLPALRADLQRISGVSSSAYIDAVRRDLAVDQGEMRIPLP